MQNTEVAFDPREFRRALGCFPTGVAIITTRDSDGTPVGLTCNSFSSVSLDPPLVQWSLRRNSRSLESFRRAKAFAINVLSEDQSEISAHFASSRENKFEGDDVYKEGLPLVDGCIAHFTCKTIAEHEAGDHIMFIGEVQSFEYHEQDPLVFYRGAYKIIAESLASLGNDGQLTAKHINEAREHVYGVIFRLACARATDEDLQRIEEKLDAIDGFLLSGEMQLRAQAALEFFQTVGYAAHNPVLAVVAHSLGSVMKKQVSASALKMDWASLHKPELIPIRRRILAKIRNRDADGAVDALTDYIKLSPLQTWA
jgi:flavin reductase (DIM6/NTAB) family NADH-FMN oxidoreductase RutF